ncbi:MAG: hypothetical protein J6B43_09250 [Lachnospiraceae bacterium]|nr:hypothetical protein [Lachnospiraceae bacterium]
MQEISESSEAGQGSSFYWQRFVSTGRVEDYLRYSNCGESQQAVQRQSGAELHAGIYHGNGNDIETDAYR